MGISLYYTTQDAVEPALRKVIERDARRANAQQPWLLCDPISFSPNGVGQRLAGSSELHLGEVSHPEKENDLIFLVHQLCRWSEEHDVSWELRLEDEPVGIIEDGDMSCESWSRIEGYAGLGDMVSELERRGPAAEPAPKPAKGKADRPMLRIYNPDEE